MLCVGGPDCPHCMSPLDPRGTWVQCDILCRFTRYLISSYSSLVSWALLCLFYRSRHLKGYVSLGASCHCDIQSFLGRGRAAKCSLQGPLEGKFGEGGTKPAPVLSGNGPPKKMPHLASSCRDHPCGGLASRRLQPQHCSSCYSFLE